VENRTVSDQGREPSEQEIIERFRAMLESGELDDLRDTLAGLSALVPRPDPGRGRRGRGAAAGTSGRRPPRREPVTYRVRIDLDGARPPIWRRLDLHSDLPLNVVHQVLQSAFGWTDSHLHRFALGGDAFDGTAEWFLCPFDVQEGEDGTPEQQVRLDEVLAEPGDRLAYTYDYGDGWDHTIVLEQVLPAAPGAPVAVCVDGRRACPPEDCGGLRTAAELAEVLDDPAHFDLDEANEALAEPLLQAAVHGVHPDLLYRLGMLRMTDVGEGLLRRLVEVGRRRAGRPAGPTTEQRKQALRPLLWFLDRVGDEGLTLTAAGYLKPVDVTATAEVLPDAATWIGTMNREVQTAPVLWFREALQHLGLVRKVKGRLLLTRAAAAARRDADALWAHLVARLVPGDPSSVQAQATLLVLAEAATAPGRPLAFDAVAQALTELDWRQGSGPVTVWGAAEAAHDADVMLRAIGVERPRDWGEGAVVSPMAAELAADVVLPRQGRAPAVRPGRAPR